MGLGPETIQTGHCILHVIASHQLKNHFYLLSIFLDELFISAEQYTTVNWHRLNFEKGTYTRYNHRLYYCCHLCHGKCDFMCSLSGNMLEYKKMKTVEDWVQNVDEIIYKCPQLSFWWVWSTNKWGYFGEMHIFYSSICSGHWNSVVLLIFNSWCVF